MRPEVKWFNKLLYRYFGAGVCMRYEPHKKRALPYAVYETVPEVHPLAFTHDGRTHMASVVMPKNHLLFRVVYPTHLVIRDLKKSFLGDYGSVDDFMEKEIDGFNEKREVAEGEEDVDMLTEVSASAWDTHFTKDRFDMGARHPSLKGSQAREKEGLK